ncbi:MAG: GNAT family N-acetyltransferase [Bdellovibrionota bacterium]
MQDYRGHGIGKKMLGALARTAQKQHCKRFEWWALRWNDSAISFYQSLGAQQLDDLKVFRVQEQALQHIAAIK